MLPAIVLELEHTRKILMNEYKLVMTCNYMGKPISLRLKSDMVKHIYHMQLYRMCYQKSLHIGVMKAK